MSNLNKKKKEVSFLNKLRRVFKGKNDKFEKQTEFYRQEEMSDNKQTDNLESASCNSDQNVVCTEHEKNEICIMTKGNSSGIEKYKDRDLSNIAQENCKNIKSGNFKSDTVRDDKNVEHQKYHVAENEQTNSKLGSDRYMNTKIAFLEQKNDINMTSCSSLRNTDKLQCINRIERPKTAILLSSSSNINIRNDTRKFVVKETKAISQENSEDSDFSADSTEDSFEDDSSEDEADRSFKSEKILQYFKDEYFTKGKYITYFFLEMERQFYNPTDVYSMVQYHDCEKRGKEGIK